MTIKNIDAKTLKNWLDNDQAILIDVRQPAEHRSQKIDKAKLIPLDEICKEKLPEIGDKKLVIHCQGGKRSLSACQKLLNENLDFDIYNLEGGINSWCSSGCSGGNKTNNFLPLDRQVQIVIGSLVVISVFLSFFVSINFLILTLIIGLGLIFAGLSGICTLANIIAKMPWNR
jgi:rhodanese-related sulfurtransferase